MTKNILCRLENVLFIQSPYENLSEKDIDLLNNTLIQIKSAHEDMFAHKVFVKDIFKQELRKARQPSFTGENIEKVFASLTTINNDVYNVLKMLSRNYDIYGVSDAPTIINDYRSYFFNLNSLMIAIFNPTNIDFKPYESLLIDFDDAVIKKAISLGYKAHRYKNMSELSEFIAQNTSVNKNNEITA